MHLLRAAYKTIVCTKKMIILANWCNISSILQNFQGLEYCKYEIVAFTIIETNEAFEEETEHQKIKEQLFKQYGAFQQIDQDQLDEFLRTQAVDEAFLNLPDSSKEDIAGFIHNMKIMGMNVHLAVDSLDKKETGKRIGTLYSYHVITYSKKLFHPLELLVKRLMDIVGSIVGLFFTVLLGIFVAPAIWMESPGPLLFRQLRIGKNGRRFYIYKFRSMYLDAEEQKAKLMNQNEINGLMFKIKDDPRVTKVGKFIRRTSIDEFPQFFNVLKGEMSLVGTRPPTEDEFMRYEARHKRRLSLKPGITGLWQVNGRSNIHDFEEVVKMDVEYIDNWSIWLDIKILFKTIWIVLMEQGAS